MAGIFFGFKRKYTNSDDAVINRMVLTAVAVVMLMCASVLLFFVYLRLPVSMSTAGALLSFFIGSLLAWKSGAIAQLIMLLSLIVGQFVILGYNMDLLVPFVIFDLFAIIFIPRSVSD
ncbi:MAG: hypothetical protein WC588_02800 [Candidatus Micrarchaeia archaeon]